MPETEKDDVDQTFKPFLFRGFVSLVGEKGQVPVIILCDSGAKQSLTRGNVFLFSHLSYTGSDIVAWGVKKSPVRAPLHFVHLTSGFVSDRYQIAIQPQLPLSGVDVILCNNLASGKFFPVKKL